METWVVVLLVVGGVFALWLLLCLVSAAFMGAGVLLGAAAQQGFLGLAAYIALWVFLFPVMLIICIIVGFFCMLVQKAQESE